MVAWPWHFVSKGSTLYIPTIYLFCELSRRLWHCGRQVSVWLASCLCPIPSLSSCIFLPSLYCHIVKGTKAHKTSPKGVLVNFVYFVMTGRKSWDWSIIFIKSPGKIIISFSTAFNRKMPFYFSLNQLNIFQIIFYSLLACISGSFALVQLQYKS